MRCLSAFLAANRLELEALNFEASTSTSDNQHSSSLHESKKQPSVHKGFKQSLALGKH